MPNFHKIAKMAKFPNFRQNQPNLSNFMFVEFSGKLSKMKHLPKIAKIRNSGQKMSTFDEICQNLVQGQKKGQICRKIAF